VLKVGDESNVLAANSVAMTDDINDDEESSLEGREIEVELLSDRQLMHSRWNMV
jgi:hypothetical protein